MCRFQPFSFDGVLAGLPARRRLAYLVLAISKHLPRGRFELILLNARRCGAAEVMVVVERLSARFDEEPSISWAEMLESIPARRFYGVMGLKGHAKMLLVCGCGRRPGALCPAPVHRQ
jgi:polyphosphate kinase